ncbi:hypothetical protein [Coleofasciculus sp. FACHB-SPT9]|uniref:hypothetical protein n=1 Tax=Cyanophyceae TaxID=3028117 RepID=UPI00168640BC|nr:hypothetical protein [Coleofasciculus sp. FACHB-SPT9]MBD1889474.1 hypothetical protein [Coleofasciculus sp. FACHB-SPT9]
MAKIFDSSEPVIYQLKVATAKARGRNRRRGKTRSRSPSGSTTLQFSRELTHLREFQSGAPD